MSYYPTPGAPYVPQQPVNPYGGMGTVGLATPLPSTQMQQAQPQRPQPMNGQQPVQQSAQDGGWLLGRPVSSSIGRKVVRMGTSLYPFSDFGVSS